MWDPECSVDSYRQSLKTFFNFRTTSVLSALEVCYDNALYKFTFDIDIHMVFVATGTFNTCVMLLLHMLAGCSMHECLVVIDTSLLPAVYLSDCTL